MKWRIYTLILGLVLAETLCAGDDEAVIDKLTPLSKILATTNPAFLEIQMQSLGPRVRDIFERSQFVKAPHPETVENALKQFFSVLEEIPRRKQLIGVIEIPRVEAEELQRTSPRIASILRAADANAKSIQVEFERALWVELVCENLRELKTLFPEESRQVFQASTGNILPGERKVAEIGLNLISEMNFPAERSQELLDSWLNHNPRLEYTLEALQHYSTLQPFHDTVLKKILSDPGSLQPSEFRVLSAIRPSKKMGDELLNGAITQLESAQSVTSAYLSLSVLRQVPSSGNTITENQSQRLEKIILEGKDWKPAVAINLLLLANKETRDRILKNVSNDAIIRLCQWDYLPEDNASTLNGIHDLLILTSLSNVPLNATALQALENYCQMPPNPKYLNDWAASSDKTTINHYAAFSILWRNIDPTKTLYGTLAGRYARATSGFTQNAYAWTFSGLRTADQGDPLINKVDTLGLRGQLTSAWRHPQSEITMKLTEDALKEKKYHELAFSKILEFGHLSQKLSNVAGAKELLNTRFSIREELMDSYSNAQIAYLMAKIFKEREKYIALSEKIFKKYYWVDGKVMRCWGPWIEFLIRIDPANILLDEFQMGLKESTHPGREFIAWLLSVRRGQQPAPFPKDSYGQVFDNAHGVDVFVGLAFTAEQKLHIIDQLRDPILLLGRSAVGIGPKTGDGSLDRNKVLAWLGAIDRIEWFQKNLPVLISPP